MNVMHELLHRSGGVIDPWDFLDPAANPPGEVKTFVVTPEMVERDARERAARQALSPEHPWAAFKASLGKVVHRSGPPRAAAGERTRKPAGTQRVCSGCLRPVRADMKGELCPACRPKPEPKVRVAAVARLCACGARIQRNNRTGLCRPCFMVSRPSSAMTPARTCSGCSRPLRANNPRDTCWQCAAKQRSRALPIALVKCSNDACSRVLRARSPEELELDRAWAELSVEDKRAVFEDVLAAAGGVTRSGEWGVWARAARRGPFEDVAVPVEGVIGK